MLMGGEEGLGMRLGKVPLSLRNVLSPWQSEAFDLEYLGRVVDVKDTVHKAPLMVHLVEIVVDKFPESSDLYSELPSVHRIAKVC